MQNVGMEKHVGDEGHRLGNREGVVGPVDRTRDDAHLYEFGRDDGKTGARGKPKTGKLQDEHEHVGGNDADRHPLVAEKLERVGIRERNEEQALVLPRLRLQWTLENRPSGSCRNSDREARFVGNDLPPSGAKARQRLTRDWPETDQRLARDWPETGQRLAE